MALHLFWEWHQWSDPQDAGLIVRINQIKQSKPCSLMQWRSKWLMARRSSRRSVLHRKFQRLDHQLMGYVLSREVWSRLLLCLGLEVLIPYLTSKMFDWWLGSRKLVLKLSRRDFDTLALLVSWHLWKECNDHTFRRCYSTLFNKVELILEELFMAF
ncbi:hypothetical protein SORBI_3009G161350 [Sorghum bicolor]|uniref:Reverse transcriptase zinc-binding domain-containing protein n=1 Tax=Sorghum bicolor TaxID=4558 RepID=A0A1Z5R448_SORBI|nr:hypothetical protein SORBI_3009G161350 [Sorghum bicolor]